MGGGQDPVEKFESLLTALGEKLNLRPSYWYRVAHIGWWRLLRESPPTVRVDDVLEAGFSPVDWEVNIAGCAWRLSKVVTEKLRDQGTNTDGSWGDFLDVVGLNRTAIERVPPDTPSESCDRILDVLNWREAVEAFDELSVKTLGYLWFCDFIREVRITDQLTAETEAVLVARALDSISILTGSDPADLLEGASSIEEAVPTDLKRWTAGFARFPFGV